MDAVTLYNDLLNLISNYNRLNSLIESSIFNENKIKDISYSIEELILSLDESSDIVKFKMNLDSLYNKTNIKLYSKDYIDDLKSKVKLYKIEIDKLFIKISNITFKEEEIISVDNNETRLKKLYYNYCISKLKEYLINYNSNKPLEYDKLNEKLKIELEKEVFINKPRVRQF